MIFLNLNGKDLLKNLFLFLFFFCSFCSSEYSWCIPRTLDSFCQSNRHTPPWLHLTSLTFILLIWQLRVGFGPLHNMDDLFMLNAACTQNRLFFPG